MSCAPFCSSTGTKTGTGGEAHSVGITISPPRARAVLGERLELVRIGAMPWRSSGSRARTHCPNEAAVSYVVTRE